MAHKSALAPFLIVIIMGWVLASMWIRVANNFFFTFMRLKETSFACALLVALFMTGIFFIYIQTADRCFLGGAIHKAMGALIVGPVAPASVPSLDPGDDNPDQPDDIII